MNFFLQPLTLLTFFPLVGVIVLLFLKPESKSAIRWTALITSLITFGISIWVLTMFKASNPGLQLVSRYPWITVAGWNIQFFLAVDGLSILLVLLTTVLTPVSILSTWTAVEDRVKEFMIFFLLLELGMVGVFLAQDLFLFYIFWEFTLVPMYFLIGIWGGPRRIYAAIKFFLYTMAGSILMLLAILWLGIVQGTFSVPDLMAKGGIDPHTQLWLFIAFAAAFAIKVPMWPLHSWLPDAHVEAPTAGSIILAGVLLKMGTYGFLRFNLGLFPQAAVQAAPFIGVLAVIGIIYGAAVSYAQADVKKLVAYSSVSHLGFVMLGLFALNSQGIQGSILQMVNHGLSTGALFLLVGVIYEQTPHPRVQGLWRSVEAHAGLWRHHAGRRPLLHGPARTERLRRRVHHPARRLGRGHERRLVRLRLVRRSRGPRHHPGCRLYPLYVPAHVPRPGGLHRGRDKGTRSPHPRYELARDRHRGPAAHPHPLDRPLPRSFLQPDGPRRGQADRCVPDRPGDEIRSCRSRGAGESQPHACRNSSRHCVQAQP